MAGGSWQQVFSKGNLGHLERSITVKNVVLEVSALSKGSTIGPYAKFPRKRSVMCTYV